MLEYALVEGFESETEFAEAVWLEALPARNYQTPIYGEVAVPVDKLERMVTNFKKNVRGQEVATNFDHGADRAKGNKASGWFRDFEVRPSKDDPNQFSLYAAVEFTDEAAAEIKSGAWKYFSMEWEDDWIDNTGAKYQDVIVGGALTNRPVAKGMEALPVNFSEALWEGLDEETQKHFAVWSTAYKNALPDSAFLFHSGSERHLPYKNAEGKVDLPHLRNAISRLSQKATGSVGGESWLSESVRSRLLARARSILSAHSKSMSEEVANAVDLLTAEGYDVVIDESKEWEHSEPGTGPTPRTSEDGSDDPAIKGGWRRSPLPLDPSDPNAPHPDDVKGDTALTPEEVVELKKALNLPEDAEAPAIIAAATKASEESKSFSEVVNMANEDREFAEKFPTRWAEHQQMLADNRDAKAVAFSESVKTINRVEGDNLKRTDKGLSTVAIDKVKEVHKKFAEGTASVTDLEEVVKTIVNGGIVDFSEVGSAVDNEPVVVDGSSPQGIKNNRTLFAEKVAEIQAEDSLDTRAAFKAAAKKYPELAAAAMQTTAA